MIYTLKIVFLSMVALTPVEKTTTPSTAESEIASLKVFLSERGNSLDLRHRIRALSRLAEIEGNEITLFLATRIKQLDKEIKEAPPQTSITLRNLQIAMKKVLLTRNTTQVADRVRD